MNQVVGGPHSHQGVVVADPVALEEVRQVKGWLGQQAVAYQVERHQQASNTPIAVQKRVDGLELVVGDGKPDQMRDVNLVIVPEEFQVAHQLWNAIRVGRNEDGVRQTRSPDPVLAGAELTRLLVLAAHTLHQAGMGLAEQAVRERHGRQLGDG